LDGEQLGRRSTFLDSGATEVEVEVVEEEEEEEEEEGKKEKEQQQQRQEIPHILWNRKVRSIPCSQEPTTCR